MYSILLTEDDQATAMMAEEVLRARGCSVRWAPNAAETRACLEKQRYDALILDLGLPDENGFDLLRALSHQYPSLPILVMTNLDDAASAIKSFRHGATDYLAKPVTPDILFDGLVTTIRRKVEVWNLQENERQRQRYSDLGQLASSFAHEVRNPLASIRTLCELLNHDLQPGPQTECVERLQKLTMRIESLMRVFLDFSRPSVPAPKILDVKSLILRSMESLEGRLRTSGTSPACSIPSGGLTVYADETQAVSILVGLLENALDAVKDPTRIRIEAAPGGTLQGRTMTHLRISDDGPGIPSHLLAKIFSPFFSTKPKGTGIGLAIAHRLALENQGSLVATSIPQQETCFLLSLPREAPRAQGAVNGR
ncbi:sensor histidine kinase [Geothrix fuzhouensis]|uniref:sensor histidine kinase n=1 Tax=Geothrix fuzhouensis TaxID=2966451 RepID=UPI002148C8B4|nr:response regulator [Geothrix fuzhouensis]